MAEALSTDTISRHDEYIINRRMQDIQNTGPREPRKITDELVHALQDHIQNNQNTTPNQQKQFINKIHNTPEETLTQILEQTKADIFIGL